VRDSKSDQRIPLSDFIATCRDYFDIKSGWKDIFFIVTQHLIAKDATYDPKR
jgi:hypothetical protein